MNSVRTSRIAALVTVTAVVLAPRASAMDIQMFDLLMDEDQREYVEFLVDVTRKVFIEMDRRDAGEKVEFLFEAIPKGTTRPSGEGQMRDILQRMRRFTAEHGRRSLMRFGDVETALVQTLVNNGIDIPRQFQRNLDQQLRENPFWPRRPLRSR